MVEITPEMQAQLDEVKKTCPFCKIIEGEIPSKKVYSDDKIVAVLDINPGAKGHTLIIPKEHYPIMPYIPAETFKHMFGMMPKLVSAIKKGILMTGANVVIANGYVAGQQSPHFLVHLIPREKEDMISNFAFDETKSLDSAGLESATRMLSQNIPIMMQNHFRRNPASWRNEHFSGSIYEDEKVKVTLAENPCCIGHLKIESKEHNSLDEMDFETSSHVFFTASFCATAVFEGLGAQGTNIILKTGISDDNHNEFSVHIVPRYEDDELDLVLQPMKQKPNLDELYSRIHDETFLLEHETKQKKPKEKVVEFVPKNEVERKIHEAFEAIRRG